MKRIIALLLVLALLLAGCSGQESSSAAAPEQTVETSAVTEEPVGCIPPEPAIKPEPWEISPVNDFAIRLLQTRMKSSTLLQKILA